MAHSKIIQHSECFIAQMGFRLASMIGKQRQVARVAISPSTQPMKTLFMAGGFMDIYKKKKKKKEKKKKIKRGPQKQKGLWGEERKNPFSGKFPIFFSPPNP